MADEHANLTDEHGVDDNIGVDNPVKAKKAGLIPTLLKYIAIAVAALIFIVTVVVIKVNLMSKRGLSQS